MCRPTWTSSRRSWPRRCRPSPRATDAPAAKRGQAPAVPCARRRTSGRVGDAMGALTLPWQRLPSPQAAVAWLRSRHARELRTDSRRVRPGDAFVAWPGAATDGRRFVDAALRAGAAACVVEAEAIESFHFDGPAQANAAVTQLKSCAGAIAAEWLGWPAERLTVIAVTGTHGKSSTAWWTAQALTALGRRCGEIGTLGIGEPPLDDRPGTIEASGLTTPDPVALQPGFARLAAAGCVACAIEASSIGIAEQRLAATPIAVAQFTNFTRDHLDYHGDMGAYWDAKRALFGWPGLRDKAGPGSGPTAPTGWLGDPNRSAVVVDVSEPPDLSRVDRAKR